MIYNITDLKVEDFSDKFCTQEGKLYACYFQLEEFEYFCELLDIKSTLIKEYSEFQNNLRSNIDVLDRCYSGCITIVKQALLYDCFDRFAFFIRQNLFVIVPLKDEDDSTRLMFEEMIERFQEPVAIGKLIYAYFEKLIYDDNRIMESIGNRVTALEENMLTAVPDHSINRQIFAFKKELLMFQDYYEQFSAIGQELQENENKILRTEDIKYIRILTNKIERLLSVVNSLMDLTIQLREVYEATLDISLNKIMKVFTVVTAIFLPLTLIAGWYGMNFKYMPELEWRYGYFYVVALAVAIVTAWILFFKRKRFL